jgi:hypothetical protein
MQIALPEHTPGAVLPSRPARLPSALWWLHPICFALFPLLSLYAANFGQLPFVDTIRPLAITLCGAAILFMGLRTLLRNEEKAALLLSLALFIFFSFGHVLSHTRNHGTRIARFIDHSRIVGAPLGPVMLAVAIVALALLVTALVRMRRRTGPLTELANVIGVVLVFMPTITILKAVGAKKLDTYVGDA